MRNGEEGIRNFGFETIFVKQGQGIELSLSPHFSSAFLTLPGGSLPLLSPLLPVGCPLP